tara:strand:+ start:2862 stop:4763 length:1902 start_codon:yes stop_codon:yes gene_type:complete
MAERKRVDPTRAKRDINFDTYVAPKEGTRINWFKQGQVIKDAFDGVAKDRTQRKEALQTEYDTALTEINEIENYDDQTMQDMAIDGVNNSANVMYDAKQRLENGKMRPADYSKFVNNIRAGQTMFRKLAGEWQTDFKRYTNRMQGADGFEQSSTLEQYIGKRMESFGNLKGMQIVTNPETGNLAFARFQDGVLLTGADDLISMQRMTAISKQEINEVNVGDEIKGVVAEIGDMITAANNTEDGMGNRGTMTLEDFMQKPEAEQILNDKAGSVLKDNNSIGSVLADNDVQNEYGESYEAGTQIDFDDWLERNSDKTPEENPIIIMGYRENGVNIVPEITDRQKEAAREFLIRGYKGALDYKETLKPDDYNYTPPQTNQANINKGERDAELLSKGKNLMMGVSGTPEQAAAGIQYLVDASNGGISGIQKTKTGFVVTYPPSADGIPTDPYTKNTDGMTAKESMRAMWKASGLQDSEFDAWLAAGGDKLLEGKSTTRDLQNAKGPQRGIKYDPQAKIILKSGEEGSAVDRIVEGPLGESPSVWEANTNAEFISEYQNLLNDEAFFPKGIGAGKVTFDTSKDPDEMIITIGGTPYNIGAVFEMNTTETVAAVQEKIQEAISNRTTGSSASKHNKKKG